MPKSLLIYLVFICFVCSVFPSCRKVNFANISSPPPAPPLPPSEENNKNIVIQKIKSSKNIKIACEGTSLTYGQDINGTDTVPSSLPNGPTRAIDQYPAIMLKTLSASFITLSLRGYPGDRTTEGLVRWKDSTQTDICIIEYGSNDAYNFAGYASGTVDTATYKSQLTQLVQRRINQGAWVILCLSPYLENGDQKISSYRSVADSVATKFNLDTFDVELSVKGLAPGIIPYSDNVHFNSLGYTNWGTLIANVIADAVHPFRRPRVSGRAI
ncbi:lysophospholipase L1-like esterase [Mucilaginibacter frigoritolerans]|uniref:Lysophospholipase L1-like esterase n=1 Tax=Mucilaginibacter frigoritolerans TaxID=652788 RepID=A0A562TKY5_9SPHI|nr:SGNH/GDSL hydrolase family protein [Mucilaginibacter frigoritolerans]TWI94225.1 lysophospholipase L1-like esterase [Mucilaginibacter frigoritolerans]